MSEMVERVARAIWDDACPDMEWGPIDKLTYTGWARAAIEAMREMGSPCGVCGCPVYPIDEKAKNEQITIGYRFAWESEA